MLKNIISALAANVPFSVHQGDFNICPFHRFDYSIVVRVENSIAEYKGDCQPLDKLSPRTKVTFTSELILITISRV